MKAVPQTLISVVNFTAFPIIYQKQWMLFTPYPTVWNALRKLVTAPIPVASLERSFSKLRLIKSHLHLEMAQEQLHYP
jgi:hypothetical protein